MEKGREAAAALTTPEQTMPERTALGKAASGRAAPERAVLELRDVSYAYATRAERLGHKVLDGVSAVFEAGTMYAIVGPSGCGKSTLLALLGGLDVPTSGEVAFDGVPLALGDLAVHRRHNVAFVFQGYNLIDYLTPAENVALATRLSVLPLLEKVGIGADAARHSVLALSGGQQQRVAVARALGSDARALLCDEPTGSLDEDTAAEVAGLLVTAAHGEGRCVVAVTHSRDLARRADHVFRLKRGRLVRER